MSDYDISRAFRRIELELVSSMKRNWEKHNVDEDLEGFTWSRWQAEELRGLEEYRKNNKTRFSSDFEAINQSAIDQITQQHTSNFFGINERRMDALIKATTSDLKKAEVAMLRTTNDAYRKIIFNSQTYLNSGAGTLKQAIDMASDDFLKRGINCVVYKNGRRVNIADYAKMSLRTSTTRATLYAGGARRNELGVHTVKVSSYGMCSPTCLPWQGRVYIDNVYSGGTAEEASRLHLPLLSTAIEGGLFHPNCKHVLTTYYMDGTQNIDNGDPRNKNDRNYLKKWENSPQEIEHLSLQNQIQAQKRIAAGSLEQSKVDVANKNVRQLEYNDKSISLSSHLWKSDNYKDITDDYFIESHPRSGDKSIDKNLLVGRSRTELDMMSLIFDTFGGDIRTLNKDLYKSISPDYVWKNKLWELKTPNGQKNVHNLMEKAINQISSNVLNKKPGGIILDLSKLDENVLNKCAETAIRRIAIKCNVSIDLIVVRNKKIIKVMHFN
jgi:hypothetical protein